MNRKFASGLALGAVALLTLTGCGTVGGGGGTAGDGEKVSPEDMTMVTVVKITGVGWFDRMEIGVNEFAKETGIDARQEGADDASPEKQIQIIQDLIPQAPTAITVVPNAPEALETVLEQARDQGIIVVTHEAAGIENADIDIEAFENKAYGAQIMDNLAECMGETGEYVSFVGGLTAKTHMEWVGGAQEKQEAEYPDMKRVEDPIETKEDENVAYQRAKELLAKYPDLKGFQGSAGTDAAGIARAVQEAGLEDSVCVMGTSIPSVAKKYLEDGSIDKAFFWDPALAGKAQLKIAELLASGKTIEEGTDLGIEGYESLTKLDGFDNVYVGDAAIEVDADNVNDFDF
ncbi:autoinducer 2 ABC transporter substrate-binding protein [Paramicrobacterium chengjingii]|uniref:Autoinducer 2 ABC transporter substrate-binding protein n=1 Tax=Paramicrobacterium chengjingii TaxID=2769067 RepID=A0ABX6YH56_9MICO|nr:autoinducer 2 ABC transporter substrate-binding protein [Microbacterium chengjingii]QPZ38129.1 autoinducer 2 ABC transporter substrate-binding protein [Microbacterium chengjingii]